MSAVCLTSYTASVLAMVGSSLVVNQMPAVASSLVASTLTPASPVIVSVPLPFATPEACINTNETLLEEITSLDWTLHQWSEDDSDKQSTKIENNSWADLNYFHMKRKGEWIEQKDWITTIAHFVQVASTKTHPTMAMPVDTLLY